MSHESLVNSEGNTINESKVQLPQTPLEEAFIEALHSHFGIQLDEGRLQYNRYIRSSSLATINDRIIGAEYTRLNPIRVNSPIMLRAYESLYPFSKWTPDMELLETNKLEFDFERHLAEIEQEEAIIESILQDAHSRYGSDETLPFTTPDYFFPELPVTQWPERFELYIFDEDNTPDMSVDNRISWDGILQNKRPDLHVTLQYGLRLKNKHFAIEGDNMDMVSPMLMIDRPRSNYEIRKAYDDAYWPESVESMKRLGLDYDQVHSSFDHEPMKTPVLENFGNPKKSVSQFALFAQQYITRH